MYTWGQLRLQLQVGAPGVPLDLIDEFLNARYQRILDHIAWTGLEADTFVQTVAAYRSSTDTAAVTAGSNAVVGTGTSWTSAITGQKFQVAGDGTLYTATFVDSTHLTLDRNYEGTTASAAAYALFQNIYSLPADCKAVLSVVSADSGAELAPLNEFQLDASVGFRDVIGDPAVYAVASDTSEAAPPVLHTIELFPVPQQAKGYPLKYLKAAVGFNGTNTGATILPWVNDAALLAGARAEIKAHLGDLAGAQLYEARFTDQLATMVRMDEQRKPKVSMQMASRFTRHRIARLQRGLMPRIPN